MLGSFPPELRGRLAATSLLRSREPTLSCNHSSRLFRDEWATAGQPANHRTNQLEARSLKPPYFATKLYARAYSFFCVGSKISSYWLSTLLPTTPSRNSSASSLPLNSLLGRE